MHIKTLTGFKCIKKKVEEEFRRGWIGPNVNCEYHPCHHRGQDCTYCFCPFYPCNDVQLGKMIGDKGIWDCSDCLFIHRKDVCTFTSSEVERLGIVKADDERLADIFKEAKRRFFKQARSIMVLGATSDAGKSMTAMALCRIILDLGYSVSPLKTQNMSLNTMATHDRREIAMVQALQSKAAGIKRANYHINPILLRPKGDTVSQVMVNGRPYRDYDVHSYYNEFVPGPGTEAVRESITYLRNRYDHIVIEGAGSPAEINIYDRDIANMRAAEMADADCVLVVNTSWGGAFAYALGTIELLEPKDRERIKAVLFNDLSGTPEGFRKGMEEFERISCVPVLGVIPHLDIQLPNEDSEFFRNTKTIGKGKVQISVIKMPKITDFTDIDPLYMENVTVRFAEIPEELDGSDAIIIPGTKNTISDMLWMRDVGIEEKILSFKEKVPILGICGGYQIMGSELTGMDGKTVHGMGLLNSITEWKGDRMVELVSGRLMATGEEISGYETHDGKTISNEKPLFEIFDHKTTRKEGSYDEERKLFGTYIHGIFDRPAFRRYFLSLAGLKEHSGKEYSEHIEENIQKTADAFKASMDMELFERSFMGGRQ